MKLKVALFRVVLICLAAGPLSAQSQTRRATFEDAITLRPRNAPPSTASLAGTVVSQSTALPVAGATVTLSRRFENPLVALLSENEPGSIVAPIQTDSTGRFRFQGLAAGDYGVAVRIDGYLPRKIGESTEQGRLTMLTLATGQSIEGFQIAIEPSARIRGHVRDESGNPLATIPIQLFLPTSTTERVVETLSTGDGSYDLAGFRPGVFVLVAGFPTPSEKESARSFAIPLVATTEATSIDIALTRRARYSIRGKVSVKGTAVLPPDFRLMVHTTPRTGSFGADSVASVEIDSKTGGFEIPALLPGFYELSGGLMERSSVCGSINTVISNRDVAGLELILEACLAGK